VGGHGVTPAILRTIRWGDFLPHWGGISLTVDQGRRERLHRARAISRQVARFAKVFGQVE